MCQQSRRFRKRGRSIWLFRRCISEPCAEDGVVGGYCAGITFNELWISSTKVVGLRGVPACWVIGYAGDRIVLGVFGLRIGDLWPGFGAVRKINWGVVESRIIEHGCLYFSTFEPPQLLAVTETIVNLAVWRFSLCS